MAAGIIIALLMAIIVVVFLMPNRAYDKKVEREERQKPGESED